MEVRQPYPSYLSPALQQRVRVLRCAFLAGVLGHSTLWGNQPPTDDPHATAPIVQNALGDDSGAQATNSSSEDSDDWTVPEESSPVSPISSGSPEFAHFPPELFGGAHIFDGVAQTSDRRLYVVAGHRLLIGTGEHWQAVPGLPDEPVNRIYLAQDERLYLSLKNDFGFLHPDRPESSNWQSIADLLPSEWNEGAHWKPLFEDDNGFVYFASGDHVFAHHPEKAMRLWKHVGVAEHVFSLHGEILVLTAQRAIYRLEANGKTEPILRDIPPNFVDIRASVPFGADRQLFAAGAAGLITFDGKHFATLQLDGIDGSHFVPDQLLQLGSNRFLALDYAHGMIVFRGDGTVLRQVHQFGDLKARIAQAVTIDDEGWIWLAHTSGLYRINPNSPQTTFDYHDGLEGRVLCMTENGGHFYVGTEDGLFIWEQERIGLAGRFRPIPQVPAARSLVSTEHGLAIGSDRGIWVLDRRGPYLVESNAYPLLLQSPAAPELLLAPTDRGIRSFIHNGSRWVPDPNAAKLPTSGLAIAIGPKGELWGEYGPGRLAHYSFPNEPTQPDVFSPREGLPLSTVVPFKIGVDMLFEGSDSVLRYLPDRHLFTRSDGWQRQDHDIGRIPTPEALLGPDQALWVPPSALSRDYIEFPPRHFGYAWPDILRFGKDPITAIYADSIGYLWVGNGLGLQRYRPREVDSPLASTRPTLVHRVVGEHPEQPLVESTAGVSTLDLGTFSSAQRQLRFEFSMLDFHQPGGTRYATFLEGFDQHWQPYAAETARAVTALPPGEYTLHVKARNRHGEEATPAAISFSIPRPITQTWWARALMGLSVLAVGALVVYLRQRKYSTETKKLRQTLDEKDALLSENADELRTRQSQLKSAVNRANELSEHTDKLVHSRARFEADLNHALRPTVANITHLGRLLGQQTLEASAGRLLEGLRRAGEQLVGSIRERLDLRQVEIDHLPIEDAPFNLRDPIEHAFAALAPVAKAKNIELIYSLEPGLSTLRTGDARRVEQILSHLLANAIEHSDAGEVVVDIKSAEVGAPDDLEFSVIDQGNGLSEDARQAVLERCDPRRPPRYRGEPQGLALARHLLDALGGELDLVSDPEDGTQAKARINLPADPEPVVSNPPEFAEKRVLIIDDNPISLKSLQMLAEQHGLLTRLANDGPQALAAFKEDPPPHLLWIDAHLDETPGHAVLTQIRSETDRVEIPAIVLAPASLSPELLELSADPHTLILDKPAFHAALIGASVALLHAPATAKPDPAKEPEVDEVPDDEPEEEEDELDAKIRAALAKSNVKPATVAPKKKGAAAPEHTSPLKILIVDAHSARSRSTLALLQRCGYHADIVENLSDATAAIEEKDRDLILLTDPVNGGPLSQAVGQLKQAVHGDASPIFVALSPEIDAAARNAGIHEHLRMPLDLSALQRVLRMVTPAEAPVDVTT